jgi:cytoskeletal protein RodZ
MMKYDEDSISFGRYLQTIRLEKKISLEKVSEETRIGLGNLLLIEQEDYEHLPAEVFVKGFLRAYAAAIGADGDEAVRRYATRVNVAQKIADSEAAMGKPAPKLWLKLLLSVVLLGCIILLSIYAISYLQNQPIDKSALEKPLLTANTPLATQPQVETESDTNTAKAKPEKLLLQISAVEETWLKVIIDEKDSKEYSLKPGDQLELSADSGYNLLIGNARGAKITLNAKPISIPGEHGQIVNIHLP